MLPVLIDLAHIIPDVIQAFKGLQKEKDALEASFKALMGAGSSTADNETLLTGIDPEVSLEKDLPEEPKLNVEVCSCLGIYSSVRVRLKFTCIVYQERGAIRQLKAQLATLSESLATITAEKSRSEANFQQDRKRLLQEKEVVRSILVI